MKTVVVFFLLLVTFVSTTNAGTCVIIKPFIAIDNIDDYKNMIFMSVKGEEATQEYARNLMQQGKCIFLLKGEKVELIAESSGMAAFKRNGRAWYIPATVLNCK